MLPLSSTDQHGHDWHGKMSECCAANRIERKGISTSRRLHFPILCLYSFKNPKMYSIEQ